MELVDQMLTPSTQSEYVVHLKMDQADALYALSDWREESVKKYLQIATDHL